MDFRIGSRLISRSCDHWWNTAACRRSVKNIYIILVKLEVLSGLLDYFFFLFLFQLKRAKSRAYTYESALSQVLIPRDLGH